MKTTIYVWQPSLETVMHRFNVYKPTDLRSAIWMTTWWNQCNMANICWAPLSVSLTDLMGSGLGVLPSKALLLAPSWRLAQVWGCIALFMQNNVGFCQMIKSVFGKFTLSIILFYPPSPILRTISIGLIVLFSYVNT
jgi:hypothetical protein